MKKLFVLTQSIMNGTVTMNTVETVFSTRELAEETMKKLKAEEERRRRKHEKECQPVPQIVTLSEDNIITVDASDIIVTANKEQQKKKERIDFNKSLTCVDGNKIRVGESKPHIVIYEPPIYFPSYFRITECNLIETEEDLKENGFEL